MFRRRTELDPLVAEAGLDPAGDLRIEDAAAHFITDAVPQLAARTHVLDRRQVPTLVVNARQPVTGELFGDVRNAVPAASLPLLRRQCRPVPDLVEHAARRVRHASGELAVLVAIVGAAGRIPGVPGDSSHLERRAVVVRRVAAAMTHDNGM